MGPSFMRNTAINDAANMTPLQVLTLTCLGSGVARLMLDLLEYMNRRQVG